MSDVQVQAINHTIKLSSSCTVVSGFLLLQLVYIFYH